MRQRIELYEKMYYHELDRRDRISARLSTPLGAMVGTTGILAYLINGDTEIPDQVMRVLFWVILSGAAITLFIGGWYFRRAWFGHTDRHIATAAAIDDYYIKLEAQCKDQIDSVGQVDTPFEKYLLDTYRRSATTNAINNDQRSTALYRAGSWLTTAMILSLLGTIPYYFGKDSAHDREEAAPATSTATAAARTPGEERRP